LIKKEIKKIFSFKFRFFSIFGHQNPRSRTGSGSAIIKNAESGSALKKCGSATLLKEGAGEGEVRRYTELETILLGLDLQQYIPLFNQHRIDLPEFLVLTEADLKVLMERDS
jgi:hypothetical protein